MNTDQAPSAADRGSALSEGLGPLPLWRDDAGRSWWGADELTGAHLLAWRDAAVAAERERLAAYFDDSDYMMYRSEVAAAIRRA